MMKRVLLVSVALVFTASAIMAIVAWRAFTREVLHQTIVSPDGRRSVLLFKRRVPPYIEGVEVTAEYRLADGRTVREVVAGEDLWGDFDVYSLHQWRGPTTLVLGSSHSFAQRPTGTLHVVNSTGSLIHIASLDAGGQKIVVLDLAPGEERSIGFPMSTDLEWISAIFTRDRSRVYRGMNFTTRRSPKKQSRFDVILSRSDIRIENGDFPTWPNKAPEPTPTSVTPPAAQESRRP